MMLLAPASIACMVLTTRPYTWYLRDDEVRLRFTSMLLTNKYIRFSKYSFFDVHRYDRDASFLLLARLKHLKGTSSWQVCVLPLMQYHGVRTTCKFWKWCYPSFKHMRRHSGVDAKKLFEHYMAEHWTGISAKSSKCTICWQAFARKCEYIS